jgi:hypothetical protein
MNFACKEVSEARSLEPHPSDPSAIHYRTPSCAYEKMPELSRARAIALATITGCEIVGKPDGT